MKRGQEHRNSSFHAGGVFHNSGVFHPSGVLESGQIQGVSMYGIIANAQHNLHRIMFKGSAAVLAVLWMVAVLSGCGGSDGAAGSAGGSFEEEVASAERYGPLVDDWKAELESDDLSDFERGGVAASG